MVDDKLSGVGTVCGGGDSLTYLWSPVSGSGTRLKLLGHRDGWPGPAQVPPRRGRGLTPYPESAQAGVSGSRDARLALEE